MKPYIFLLIILSISVLFFHLSTRPFLSSGEARASEIAVEMLERGNFLIPYINERIILTKPPLFHWLIIICYRLFGINEFSSRVPSALAGLMVVILVYLLGKRLWDKRTGFISGIILLTSPLFFWSARCARIDSLLLFLITFSIYCFWRGYEDLSKGKLWFLGWFFTMGLGMLAKGHVGVIIPLIIPILFLFFIRKQYYLRRLNWFWGLLLFFIVVLPWYTAIYFLVPHYKSEIFFLQQIWEWFIGKGNWYKGYLYIPYLFLGFSPWSLALPIVFLYTWNDFRLRKDERIAFLWIWVFVVLFIFGFFGKRVGRYILPLYPAISLLIAKVISSRRNINRIFSFALVVLWVFIILAISLFSVYAGFLDPELVSIIEKYMDRVLIIAIGILVLVSGFYGVKKNSFAIPVIIVFISLFMFIMYVIPIEKDYYSPKPFCEMLKEEVPQDARLRAYKSWDNTIRYYLGRHVGIIPRRRGLLKLLNSKDKVFCFMQEDIYERLPEEIKKQMHIVRKGYKVLEHKVVLVSNKE